MHQKIHLIVKNFFASMEHSLDYYHNFVRVLIEPDDQDARYFYRETDDIQRHILDQICANCGKLPYPHFGGEYEVSDEGAIIINPHVETVPWLEQVIKSYTKRSLKITNFKDRVQYTTKVEGWVPEVRLSVPLVKMLQLLQAQNHGLRTENWRVLNSEYASHNGNPGQLMTFLIDEPSREVLQENGFKLFLGFSIVSFDVVEKVKRCEITGKIVIDDDVQIQLDDD